MVVGHQRSRIGRAAFSIVASLALLLALAGGVAAQGNGAWSVAANVSHAEGNSGTSTMTFVVHYAHNGSWGSNRVDVDWATSNGTATGGASCATAGVDYITANGTVDIPAGADSNTNVNVTICGDPTVEGNETFSFTLSGPSSSTTIAAGTSPRTGTITNDDAAATTTTTLASSLNPSVSGQSVTFTATVAPAGATGVVRFYDGATLIGTSVQTTGSRTFATAALSVGSHSITAVYAGDTSFLTSTSTALVQVVNSSSTTTTLASSLNPSNYNQSVTFTATVAPAAATGVVQFYDGGTLIGTSAQTTGNRTYATTTLSIGSHPITAVFVANGGYLTSTSPAVTQVVNGTNTTTTVTSGTNPAYVGASVTFTATVAPAGATGTVSFYDGATLIGTSAQTTGNRTYSTTALEPGSHSITAVYAGGGAYNSSTSPALTQTITATQLHLVSAVCARYTDVPANRWYTTTPPADDTLGHASELNNSNPISEGDITGNTTAANCERVAGWTFNLSTGDMGGTTIPGQTTSYTTGAGGMVTVPLNTTLFALANHPDGATALWVKETTQPNWAGFGSLHCYSNQLYADNLDTIYGVPVGTADVYCLVYNVQTLTLAKSANPTTFSTLGQTITYTYTVINTGGVTATPLALPTISDDKINGGTAFDCGAGTLAYNATRTCTATYHITQADLDAGTVTNTAVAHAGTVTSNQAEATVTRRPVLTITALPQSKTYGNAYTLDTTLGVGYSVTGLQAGDSVTGVTLTASGGLAANASVGGYTITPSAATGTGLDKYDIQYATGTLTVNPRVITIGADPQVKTYGDVDPALTFGIASGSLAPGDSFTGSLTRAPGEDVGSYAIFQGTASVTNASNYTITYSGATLTITPLAITVTAEPKSKFVGAVDPALTYTTSVPLVAGDSFSGGLTRVAGETIGAYQINQGTLALSTNYAITYVPANLTITGREITITAEAKTKVYGDPDPALTYTVSGSLAPGDTVSGSLTRAPGEDVGPYAIGQGSVTVTNASNYTITYVAADLTITALPITVTAEPKSKFVGAVDPALTYTTSVPLVAGDSFSGGLTRVAGETIGAYQINQGTLALSTNYAITYVPANLTITGREITITAEAKTKVYGDPDPALTYTVSGSLAPGDTVSGSLTRAPGEDVGPYAIGQGSVTVTNASNYTITYVAADLTITPIHVTITATTQNRVYGDTFTLSQTAYTVGPLTAGGSVTGVTITASGGTAVGDPAGTYDLTPSAATGTGLGGYIFDYVVGDLIVARAPLTITASDGTMVAGGTVPTITPIYSAFVNGDTVGTAISNPPTCVANVTAASPAGTYTSTCSGAAAANYAITYLPGVVTVTAAPNPQITLNKTANSATYNHVGQVITYTYRITNSGNTILGPDQFTVSDDRINGGAEFNCGASNQTLAVGASFTCTGTYTIAQADLDFGSVTNVATASLNIGDGRFLTSTDSVTITFVPEPRLTLVKHASVSTFTAAGNTITYTYTVTNSGNVTLLAPFSIADDKITLPNTVDCSAAPATLAPAASFSCTAVYTVTAGDDTAGYVTNIARATAYYDDGTVEPNQVRPAALVPLTSDPASVTVTKAGQPTPTPTEIIGGETAVPGQSATPPVTSSGTGNSGSDQLPIAVILIATAFGLLGLLAVEAQRRSLRRR